MCMLLAIAASEPECHLSLGTSHVLDGSPGRILN
jgi:hypothetical protein